VLYNKPVIETEFLSKNELIKLRRKFFITFAIKHNLKLSTLKRVFTDKEFRGKVKTALKRYIF